MRESVRLWRWRRNPLMRRSDVMEAWIGLFTMIAVFCTAPVAAWAAGHAADRVLHRAMRAQQAERTKIQAVLVPEPRQEGTTAGAIASDPERAYDPRQSATVRWTAPDGSSQSAIVRVDDRQRAAGRMPVWTDRAGRLVDPPLPGTTVAACTTATGAAAALGVTALLCGLRGLLCGQLMRRRLADWDRLWVRADLGWGRTDAGG